MFFNYVTREAEFTDAVTFERELVDISEYLDTRRLVAVTALDDRSMIFVSEPTRRSLEWVRVDSTGNQVLRSEPGGRLPATIRPYGDGRLAVVGHEVGRSISTYLFDPATLQATGDRILTSSPVSDLTYWDVTTGWLLAFAEEEDGSSVLHLVEPEGEPLIEPFAVDGGIYWTEANFDRTYALVGTDRGNTYIVDLGKGTVQAIPVTATLQGPQMLPDKRFVVYDESGQYQLWDFASARQIGVVATPGPLEIPILAPSTASDGSKVWILDQDEFIGIPLDPDEWFRRACAIAGRSLTEAEWREFVPGDRPYDPACPQAVQ